MGCGDEARRIKGALEAHVPAVEVEHETAELGALSFNHPVHDATVMVVVADPDARSGARTTTVLMIVGDWHSLREDEAGLLRLLGLNARLMTCAVAVVPFGADEHAVVLCRRAPTEALPPEEVLPLIEDMAWEYAHESGWVAQAQEEARERDGAGAAESDTAEAVDAS